MKIIGQRRLLKTIEGILTNSSPPFHLLFIAPSGYGKTFIATGVMKIIKTIYHYDYMIRFETGKDAEEFFSKKNLPKKYSFVVFIDEIHTIQNPEILYPLFRTNHSILAATNTGEIAEPLKNRFINLPLEIYSNNELKEIFMLYSSEPISKENFEKILIASGKIPRKLKQLAELWSIFKEELFTTYLSAEGFTNDEIIYIRTLQSLGGKSSLARIKSQTTFSTQYLNSIESGLVQKGLLEITHSGRQLIKEV